MFVRTLDDGLAVWVDAMRDVRSVAVGLYAAGGSADEPPDAAGSTHFLEHLLFKRTRRRSGPAIARMTDLLGGDCDAYTTRETVAFHARTTSERLGDAVDLLLDLTEAPAFTADDVEMERAVILEEMAEARDLPEDLLHDSFLRALWPSHPLGAPIFGTEASVGALTRSALAGRFREVFRPGRSLFVAVGALDPERFVADLAKRRSRRRAPAGTGSLPPRGRSPRAARCALHLLKPGLQQAHLLLGAATIPAGHRLVPAAWMATTILGGGVSSRLWRDVRERRGLAYGVSAGLTLHRASGVSTIEASTAPRNLSKLVRTTARTLKRLVEDGPTRAEVSRARAQIRAEIALSLESTASRREAAARAFFHRGRPVEAAEMLAELDAASHADVEEALRLLYGALGPLGIGIAAPEGGPTVEELAAELAA